jgi:hypothetical protein
MEFLVGTARHAAQRHARAALAEIIAVVPVGQIAEENFGRRISPSDLPAEPGWPNASAEFVRPKPRRFALPSPPAITIPSARFAVMPRAGSIKIPLRMHRASRSICDCQIPWISRVADPAHRGPEPVAHGCACSTKAEILCAPLSNEQAAYLWHCCTACCIVRADRAPEGASTIGRFVNGGNGITSNNAHAPHRARPPGSAFAPAPRVQALPAYRQAAPCEQAPAVVISAQGGEHVEHHPPRPRFLQSSPENASNLRLVGRAGRIRTDRRLCSRSVSHLNTSNRLCQDALAQ